VLGLYDLKLAGYLNPYLKTNFNFRLLVEEKPYPNTSPPKFRGGNVPFLIKVGLNSVKSIKIPKVYDPDDDDFTISIFFDGLSTLP
jgi:hypothetical protein